MRPERIAQFCRIRVGTVNRSLGIGPEEEKAIFDQVDAEKAFNITTLGSESEIHSMEKWLSLCTTIDQVVRAFDKTSYGSRIQILAMEKWLSLCTTIDQVVRAFEKTRPDSEVRTLVIRKMAEMLDEE